MGVEPFIISSSVIAILAQRLVRRVCERCVETYVPPPEYAARLGLEPGVTFVRGKGCNACGRLGYRGRVGVYELLVMTPEIRRMVMGRLSSEEIKSQALAQGMKTLRDDAIAKALAGITTPEEVLRVTQDRQTAEVS
jgi:type II secretory ATPase GspE/PulE/Tfp pilus assembly ATPase PilB-like protein